MTTIQGDTKRICSGYAGRSCSTILSRFNPDSICSVCSARRADEIATANEKRSIERVRYVARVGRWRA